MPNFLELASADTDDKFVNTLNVSEDGMILVQSIEFIADFARTRVSLSRKNRLDEFFCPEVTARLTGILTPALKTRGIISLPDQAIQLPDVLLEGCRVIIMAAAGGGENVIVRFRKCYGAIFSVLNENVPLKKNLVDKSVLQSIEMLENAYIPLFSLSRYLDDLLERQEGGLERHFGAAARAVNDQIKSLEMYNFFKERYLNASAPPFPDDQSPEGFAHMGLEDQATAVEAEKRA